MNDPFAQSGSDRTFIVPKPGARSAGPAHGAPPAPGGGEVARDFPQISVGLNPLVALANEVLSLVPSLRNTVRHADPASLKEQLSYAIREFERRARAEGVGSERVNAARYILCTVLDEAAAGTPWGGSGVWARQSLLAAFHNETGGGEKVFQLMARLAENVPANRDLLELIYACLALGFEGRYRTADGGGPQLDAVRERLALLLRNSRGDYPRALAQNWKTSVRQGNPMASWLPLWVTVSAVAALLAILYISFSFSLAARSDGALSLVQSLRLETTAAPVLAPPARPRLAQFLAQEIAAGWVEVRDMADRSVVTIRGDGLFESGSTVPTGPSASLFASIGAALRQVPGAVVISGHTDNQPIRSARYPSNWELSQARAQVVRELLAAQGVALERLRSEGRADTEPLERNDSPEGRSRNRRVEVTLFAGNR